jgi:hypothetical protein
LPLPQAPGDGSNRETCNNSSGSSSGSSSSQQLTTFVAQAVGREVARGMARRGQLASVQLVAAVPAAGDAGV